MQVIIDIHEKDYQAIKNGHIPFSVLDVIMNGTPLPKGHGRLIDADTLPICHGVFLPRVNGNTLGCPADAVFVSDIEDAPTIIEADKGDEKT